MSATLAPNRIHSLPVRVSYYLPTTLQTFSTLFASPQQVYVHPSAAAAASSKRDTEDEAWGSIYLKTVVMGVLLASPELHPSHPHTPDLSLYVLDPRETYLRRSRAGSSPYVGGYRSQANHHTSSSPASSDMPSSPAHGSYAGLSAPSTQEVWTGKGLVSWALDEPGQGKNLITGRLVRSTDFTRITKEETMSPLEALMAADAAGPEDESWGIEISVGLKSGVGAPVGIHNQVSSVMSIDGRPDALRRSSASSSTAEPARLRSAASIGPESSHFQRPSLPLPKRQEQPRRPHMPQAASSSSTSTHPHPHPHAGPHHPLAPPRAVSASKSTPARPTDVRPVKAKPSGGRRRKNHAPASASVSSSGSASAASRNQLSTIDPNADPLKRRSAPSIPTAGHTQLKRSSTAPQPSSDASEPFPTDIPAGLYAKPESLTREQAQRLLASPAFLSMLEKLTGAPVDLVAAAKRARDGDDSEAPSNKRLKQAHAPGHTRKGSVDSAPGEAGGHNGFVCWNCGRTKSAVWRTKVMDDGKSVRVCNACGLYWNKMGSMRPPTLWGDVDDDPKDRPRKDKKGSAAAAQQQAASSAAPASAPPPASASAPASEPGVPAHRIDKPSAARSSEGFKRTLSSVVEQDAKRIASLRTKAPMPKSSLQHSMKPVPMSSPPRGSTSATKSLRNAKWGEVAASSPGGWGAESSSRAAAARALGSGSGSGSGSDNFHTDPVQQSPATSMRKSFSHHGYNHGHGHTAAPSKQTLDMPLSDDDDNSQPKPATQVDWGTDLSAFFDVDGFSMPPNALASASGETTLAHRTHGISSPAGPTDFHRALSSDARKRREARSSSSAVTAHVATDPSMTEEDDVLSQLFNRTSSVGVSSSPVPFDFSALPPSSPPVSVLGSDLPHSALLLSSPDNSPVGFSPMDTKTTPGKSRLRHSVTVSAADHARAQSAMTGEGMDFEDIQRMLNNIGAASHSEKHHGHGHSPNSNSHSRTHSQIASQGTTPQTQGQPGGEYDMLHELFGKIAESHSEDHSMSSTTETEAMVGHAQAHGQGQEGDIFAMLEGHAFA